MLLASRALCHMMDVLPSSPAALVHYDAVPLFCERLLSIEYIDLAEQALQALEKLSHEHPLAILRAGGMLAVLQFVDFFATGVQRIAVSTAVEIDGSRSTEVSVSSTTSGPEDVDSETGSVSSATAKRSTCGPAEP